MKSKKQEKNDVLTVLRQYKGEFEQKYGVTSIGIFGSVARGEAKAGSDIDVIVKMCKPDLYYMVHIKETLEAALHSQVDIIHYRERMNTFLRNRINRDVIYA